VTDLNNQPIYLPKWGETINKSNITGLISYRGWDTNIETVTVKAVMGAI